MKKDIFRKVSSAKKGIIKLIEEDISNSEKKIQFDENSPDGDEGKLSILNKPARVIHTFQGYHLPVRSEWFEGKTTRPRIRGKGINKGESGEFEYYILAIEPRKKNPLPKYFIIHYKDLINWVKEFNAPRGRNRRERKTWMANVAVSSDGTGYFRWGDEPNNERSNESRIIKFNNLNSLDDKLKDNDYSSSEDADSKYGKGGESDRHKNLKEHVRKNPEIVGLSKDSKHKVRDDVERLFISGDRADVVFVELDEKNKIIKIIAVEIELEGSKKLLVGAYQAIKYAILSAAEESLPLEFGLDKKVRAVLVAHETNYSEVISLCEKYGVGLIKVPESKIISK